jgi:RNA polymerase sigma factor (sigma-70 family)
MKGFTFVGQKPDALLYERQAPALLAYFYRQTASWHDAEDLLVEVFLAALEHERFRDFPESEQERWLWKVARYKAADHFRRFKRQASLPLDVEVIEAVIADPALTPENSLIQQETYAELHTTLKTLPREQQELLELRFGYELSFGQIATVLAKTEGAVRMMLLRTLKQLRAMYKKSAR